jgi:hypothetical protein
MRYSLPEESAWALRATIEELSDDMSAEVLATALLIVSTSVTRVTSQAAIEGDERSRCGGGGKITYLSFPQVLASAENTPVA